MNAGTAPAIIDGPLSGGFVYNSGINNKQQNKFTTICNDLQDLTQNKWGHNKNNPRFSPVFTKHLQETRKTHVQEEFVRRLQTQMKCRQRQKYSKKQTIKIEDWYLNLTGFMEYMQLLYHEPKNNRKSRRRRSDGFETIWFKALSAIVYHINLLNMTCGYFNRKTEKDIYYNYEDLSIKAGISIKQFSYAMKFFQKIGIVKVNVIKEIFDDIYIRTKDVIITINNKIFEMFGLRKELEKDKTHAEKRFIKFKNKSIKRLLTVKQREKGRYYFNLIKDVLFSSKIIVKPPPITS